MEEDQELRFVCKFCNKRYPCGKALGGHIRTHMTPNSAESEEKLDAHMKKISSLGKNIMDESKVDECGNGQSGYGLRENPKKTWRAVDIGSPLPQEKVCKQCGKGFQSLKALCGHMACHSEKERGGFKDDRSWTSENQKLGTDSNSDMENEESRPRTRFSKSKRYKNVITYSPSYAFDSNFSSPVFESEAKEREEVASWLMMLSRDSGSKGGGSSGIETSDNNSVVLETKSSSIDMRNGRKEGESYVNNLDETGKTKGIEGMKLKSGAMDDQKENSDSGYFLDECAIESEVSSFDGFKRNNAFGECKKASSDVEVRGEESIFQFKKSSNRRKSFKTELLKNLTKENGYDDDADMDLNSLKRKYEYKSSEMFNGDQKRSKYECMNCKKTFNSYQALGGHRPCHKRNNAGYEKGESSLDDATDFAASTKLGDSARHGKLTVKSSSPSSDEKLKSKKNKPHVCPFCDRVFKNGQALGGHKRSHFIVGHVETSNQAAAIEPDLPNLLDLNLPAPEEDEDADQGQFVW